MTEKLARILIRQSELRERINGLIAKDELSESETAELSRAQSDARGVETELREALKDAKPAGAPATDTDPADPDPEPVDAEERERRELRGKSTVAGYVGAAIAGSALTGPEAEYAAAMGCPGLMPLTVLGPTLEERQSAHGAPLEERAVTPAPADADTTTTHAPIVPQIFDRSVADYLGIVMPTVPTGIRSYPVLSTGLLANFKADDGDADEQAGAFTVTDADPRRLTGSFRIRKTDIAKLAGLEPALRQNLPMVLRDRLDVQVVAGDNANDVNLNGVQRQLTAPDAPAANAETFVRYAAALISHVDGLMATGPMDVRALVGPHTLRHMGQTFSVNAAGTATQPDSALSYAMRNHGGIRASRRIADPVQNVQEAIIRRSNPAGDAVAVAPVWMGVELIRDMYGENAKKGEITVTATMLVGGVVLLRALAFARDSFRLA